MNTAFACCFIRVVFFYVSPIALKPVFELVGTFLHLLSFIPHYFSFSNLSFIT